jgi:PBP1b-binding outer membrane lipoprotein LpoB
MKRIIAMLLVCTFLTGCVFQPKTNKDEVETTAIVADEETGH